MTKNSSSVAPTKLAKTKEIIKAVFSFVGVLVILFTFAKYAGLISNPVDKFISSNNLQVEKAIKDIPDLGIKKDDRYYLVSEESPKALKFINEFNEGGEFKFKPLVEYKFKNKDYNTLAKDSGFKFFYISEGSCHACGVDFYMYDRNAPLEKRIMKLYSAGSWGTLNGKFDLTEIKNEIVLIHETGYTAQGRTECATTIVKYKKESGSPVVANSKIRDCTEEN